MKRYSPRRSTLNVSMPWMRRRTGSCGIVYVAPSSCTPTFGEGADLGHRPPSSAACHRGIPIAMRCRSFDQDAPVSHAVTFGREAVVTASRW